MSEVGIAMAQACRAVNLMELDLMTALLRISQMKLILDEFAHQGREHDPDFCPRCQWDKLQSEMLEDPALKKILQRTPEATTPG